MPTATVSATPRATPSRTVVDPAVMTQVLQEEHDLEALAVDGGEAEQREAEQEPPSCARRPLELAPAPVVGRYPARPVDLVEEPVHDDEQNRHRQQPRRGLDVESRPAERSDHPDREEPRRDRRRERNRRTARDRAAQPTVGADEARGEGGEHEHRLQPFTEDEQGAVDDDRAVAQVGSGGGGIGHTVRSGDRLPRQRGDRRSRDQRPGGPPEQAFPLGDLLDGGAAQPHL